MSQIAKAIVAAQRGIHMVAKDATNQHHKYAYVSAEQMIEASRKALLGAGLALLRTAARLSTIEGMPIVSCDYLLLHEGGESMEFKELPWLVIEGNGRPLDKAMAGALTTSMGYFLRDLLLIPKGDEAEVDKRDDTQHKVAVLGVTGAVTLRKKLRTAEVEIQELVDVMREKAGIDVPEDMAQWDKTLLPRIDKWLKSRKEPDPRVISPDELARTTRPID